MRLKILGIPDGHNASVTLSEDGWNVLVGGEIEKIVKAIKGFEARRVQRSESGDGRASERTCENFENYPEYQERFR